MRFCCPSSLQVLARSWVLPLCVATRRGSKKLWLLCLLFVGLDLIGSNALAAGTAAGQRVVNAAEIRFRAAGASADATVSSISETYVDELLDVVVTNDDGAAVLVSSPQTQAVLQFSVVNVGNGRERFRLVPDATQVGNDFDSLAPLILLESNGISGLQQGAGGDTEYVLGSNDPELLADGTLIAYVQVEIPSNLQTNDLSTLELRAVPITVFANAGTDDPTDSAFPAVATAYPGAGDALSGPPVIAVVGATHNQANLLLRATGALEVGTPLLNITKNATSVVDPSGGGSVVPGAIVTYEIQISVVPGTTADNILITDPLPTDLRYVDGSLTVSNLPAGQDVDDDFEPVGVDDTGFDLTTSTVRAIVGSLNGGDPTITVSFQAAVR